MLHSIQTANDQLGECDGVENSAQRNPRPQRPFATACFGAALVLLMAGPTASRESAADARGLADVITLIDQGQFKTAENQIVAALPAANLPAQQSLTFERERMRRILLDFSLDRAEVEAHVRKQIPDLTEAEFAKWDAAGLFEHQVIDGRKVYFNRSPSNLFRLSADARARRDPTLPADVDGPLETPHPHHAAVARAALASGRSSVEPRHVRVTQSLTVNADTVPAGKSVRAWIPYPRALPGQQENIRFVTSAPARHVLAPESALQRTVYLEQPAQAGKPTVFSVTYELTIYAQYHAIDPDKVIAATITRDLAPFVAERAPHVVFTDAMRLFSAQVVGDEKNPYRIAQTLFAAVDRIPWAGAREYSTISNIGDYALHAGHADCGQQTLLLITLLRLNGIPARWQSGMVYFDGGYDNLHDWGWLYLAPYGWIPMDVTFGHLASGDPATEWFYLGGMDAYRIAFNDDYSRDFVPPKMHARSETVDLQRGEVEWDGGNLYFDQWDYAFKAEVLPAAARDSAHTTKSTNTITGRGE